MSTAPTSPIRLRTIHRRNDGSVQPPRADGLPFPATQVGSGMMQAGRRFSPFLPHCPHTPAPTPKFRYRGHRADRRIAAGIRRQARECEVGVVMRTHTAPARDESPIKVIGREVDAWFWLLDLPSNVQRALWSRALSTGPRHECALLQGGNPTLTDPLQSSHIAPRFHGPADKEQDMPFITRRRALAGGAGALVLPSIARA